MKKVGIIGATGYTGSELVRLLHDHKEVEIVLITSESKAGSTFSEIHPQFRGICDLPLTTISEVDNHPLDVVFLALPHGVSMDFVKDHADKPYKIIDLSGDFRLSTASSYEEWYQQKHLYPEGLSEAVFGLPELYRKKIENARLIANPGCYPTASILAVAPLLKEGLAAVDRITIDAKSGVTGAGIKARPNTHFPNVNDNFMAYGIGTHRHSIEIQEQLSEVSGTATTVLFTPHLLPLDRGILSSAYLIPKKEITQAEVNAAYQKHYGDEFFIRYSDSVLPNLKGVRGTNRCDVYAQVDNRTNTIIAMASIDNLVKGAAGQAIQNMNILLGFEESAGLQQVPLQP